MSEQLAEVIDLYPLSYDVQPASDPALMLASVDGELTEEFRLAFGLVEEVVSDKFDPVAFHLLQDEHAEKFGMSLYAFKDVGRLCLMDIETEVFQETPEVRQLSNEFASAFGEVMKTAPGVGEYVTVERTDEFLVQDNLVRTLTGEPMQDLVARGIEAARRSSKSSPAMGMQVERDQGYYRVLTEQVQPMWEQETDYNTVFALSANTDQGVHTYGEKFWKDLGYNTKHRCAMLHKYHRLDDGTLVTRDLSIDEGDVTRLAVKLRTFGRDVPEDISETELINYTINVSMTNEEADEFMDDFVAEFEADTGLPPKLTTTKKLMEEQSALRERAFQTMYLPIAESLAWRQKTPLLSSFIAGVLPAAARMDEESAHALHEVHSKDEFNEDDARFMHGVVLFAVGMSLQSVIHARTKHWHDEPTYFRDISVTVPLPVHDLAFITQMGDHFVSGVKQGIKLGGCGASFGFSESHVIDAQRAFGSAKANKLSGLTDKYGARDFTCSKGHPNFRRVANVPEPRCSTCGEDISCGLIKTKPKKSEKQNTSSGVFKDIYKK